MIKTNYIVLVQTLEDCINLYKLCKEEKINIEYTTLSELVEKKFEHRADIYKGFRFAYDSFNTLCYRCWMAEYEIETARKYHKNVFFQTVEEFAQSLYRVAV
jgi:hypothetical protein